MNRTSFVSEYEGGIRLSPRVQFNTPDLAWSKRENCKVVFDAATVYFNRSIFERLSC